MVGWCGHLEHSSNPDTDVGGHYVHQPEPSEALELLDVQLGQGVRREQSGRQRNPHNLINFAQG